MDWAQIWKILSVPDNVPITLLAILVPFYTWYGLRQAVATDRLIGRLQADPALAKTHHRKIHPYLPKWAREVPVWPYLLKIEFLAAIIVTLILMIWSITLNAPLEEPANPNFTMNPSKAPWYFVGLQEMLVYFDPWFAGVVLPSLIVVGLMVFPYVDTNPLGLGYYTIKQPVVPLLRCLVLPLAADLHRHVRPRARLDVVLAGPALGSHPGHIRGEPQSARRVRLGQVLEINGLAGTVIGIAPPGFFGETVGTVPDLWLPMSVQPRIMPADYLNAPNSSWLSMLGRLRPGVSPRQTQAALEP